MNGISLAACRTNLPQIQRGELAMVTDIQKFSVHDGPGIRTIVFFKGCPLRCKWCQNPETWNPQPELLYYSESCIHCGGCAAACPNQALSLRGDGVHIDVSRCTHCGVCADACYPGAMKQVGALATTDELLQKVLEDEAFYRSSGGGLTLSGGECTTYAAFAAELLRKVQARGIHTAIETCGFCSWERFAQVIAYTDLILFDVKAPNPGRSRDFIGQDNTLITENLRRASDMGKETILRLPLIPGVNTDSASLHAIGELAQRCGIQRLHILPLHQFGSSKWYALHRNYTFADWTLPTETDISAAALILGQYSLRVSIGGSDYS